MNTSPAPLLAGMVIGFSVAVPIGPMGLLCIQRTLASGMRVGWFTGLGAATVNAFYGMAIIFGFGQLGPLLAQGSRVLSRWVGCSCSGRPCGPCGASASIMRRAGATP